jgi:hypothetical protein
MPRYLVDLASITDGGREHALALAPGRFPEVEVEQVFVLTTSGAEVWICRAPNGSHIERWLASSGELEPHIRAIARVLSPRPSSGQQPPHHDSPRTPGDGS